MSIETMSQGQDKKNKIPQLHFRLFDFNIYEEELDNLDGDSGCNSDDSEEYKKKKDDKGLTIQMFGINELGETCTIFIRDYQPFFYVKVGDDWSMEHKRSFINRIKTSNEVGKYYEDSIIENECKLIKRKKLYGFDGGKEHKFIKLVFKNTTTMNKVKNLWYEKGRDGKMNLKKSGFIFDYTSTTIYESNIPPLLRYFHIKEISPSGWISIPKYKSKTPGIKKTTCKFEYELKTSDITPLNDKETIVPYKICSFDIEASSSHGDFPLAVKSYKKLAINIIDIYNNLKKNEEEMTKEIMYRIICSAFGHDNYDDVDIVYTKKKLSVEETTEKFKIWFEKHIEDIEEKENEIAYTNTIENMFEKMIANNKDIDNGNYGDDDDDDDDAENNEENFDIDEIENYESKQKNTISDKKKTKPKTIITVLDLLKNDKIDRDIKIEKINNLIQSIFPKVEGDKVTFIGSTFLKYGNKRPYLNHCITLDSCNDLSDEVTNSIIESYDTERDVLLAWTRLIQKENPDIIIGYNICGFDYEFMFRRALENNCEKQFLLLSRNNNEFCATKDIKTGELSIEKNSIVIASGQHDLHFIKMNGRLQIDLYNYFRRDYNLTSYKLDYCAGYFIGDGVKKIEHLDEPKRTKIYSSNLMGLENGNYVVFEENSHSTESYKDGTKFKVFNVDETNGTFEIPGIETPDMKKSVRWGFAKDDVTPQDMFRMTKEGPKERAIIAKYCIQDCNLVHHLMNKIDVMTGYIEMSKICSVPISFLVMRGQGIKLTSFIAKKCREKKTLMPVVEKSYGNESYEGAIVLPPKCNLYLDNPVACLDYSSLYPSSMISENLSHDSKVWTKEYNLNGELIRETGEKDGSGNYIYDNLPKYDYVDVTYDTYKWIPNERGKAVKTVSGKKICRFAQPTDGSKAIMPSVLEELLAARKATRKLAEAADDPFIANILDKRQLGYKVTANSLYGQCGAKTSTFYEVDVAASTTATGRKLLTYGKRIVEEVYGDTTVESKKFGFVNTKAEYIYGDTDSVFFTFNLATPDGIPIRGKDALEITIEIAQQVGHLATKFLKSPHAWVYEKTLMPFCLLSKKRYVGMLYETTPEKPKRKSMGIVLKRRDNAPIVKDIYGGIIDILMKEQNVEQAIKFLKECLNNMVQEKYPLEKLIITKSLRSGYKNPAQIAHKVLADRMGKRDPGNKPSVGDRIPFVYIHNENKKALQGEKIEHPNYIIANKLRPNYSFYITNQIMKPVQQVFALVLENIEAYKKKIPQLEQRTESIKNTLYEEDKIQKKITELRNKEVKALLFDDYLTMVDNANKKNQSIMNFFKKK